MADDIRLSSGAAALAAGRRMAIALGARLERVRAEHQARLIARLRMEAPRLIARSKASAPRIVAGAILLGVLWMGASLVGSDGEPAPETTASVATRAPAAPAPVPRATWTPIPKPIELYALEAPELLQATRSHEARRFSEDGARDDLFVFNQFADDKLFLALRLRLSPAGAAPAPSLFVELARHAADDGLAIERMASPTSIDLKFGDGEAADVVLAQRDAERACLAFRFAIAPQRLRASGFACGSNARPLDRAQLACLVDRLMVMTVGDPDIRAAFARAELNRRADCNARAGGGRRASWLDPAGSAPNLKGALAAKR